MGQLTTSIENIINRDKLACEIGNLAHKWSAARDKKHKEWAEVRSYVFATDTTTTSNAKLPWRNTTTRPKLCQIRDNLHANYMAALFPTEKWFRWIPDTQSDATKQKAEAIEGYMKHKLDQVKFDEWVSRALLDFIDYGNCYADVEYVREVRRGEDGEEIVAYEGPKPVRISPLDIWFDVTAASFERTPKIVRYKMTIGDIAKLIEATPPGPEKDTWVAIFNKMKDIRQSHASYDMSESVKNKALIADGFGTLTQYYESNTVELLRYEGDIYDPETQQLYVDHRITVVDRAWVVENRPLDNWLGRSTIVHTGWRLRPDNLIAMGPLDNLVGLQYRIDHLENLRADVFDMIAFPIVKHKGYTEDWEYAPGERIFLDEDADAEYMVPDTTALNADLQIRELEDQMEEMAGAPRQAMGIRTPGEKTAFEVNKLENAASRLFQNKINHFEKMFLDPVLNAMVEVATRNLDAAEEVRVLSRTDAGLQQFKTITKADITAKGALRPIGARHFATQNRLVENLTQLSASPIYQDPSVNTHISGLKIAEALEDAMQLTQYSIVDKNIRIFENMETQQEMAAAQETVMGTGLEDTEIEEDSGPMISDVPEEEVA